MSAVSVEAPARPRNRNLESTLFSSSRCHRLWFDQKSGQDQMDVRYPELQQILDRATGAGDEAAEVRGGDPDDEIGERRGIDVHLQAAARLICPDHVDVMPPDEIIQPR